MFKKCLLIQLGSRGMLCIWRGLLLSVVHFRQSSWHFSDSSLLQGWRTAAVPLTFPVFLWYITRYFFCAILFVSFLVAFATKVCSEGLKCVQRSWEVPWDLQGGAPCGSVDCSRQNAVPSRPAFLRQCNDLTEWVYAGDWLKSCLQMSLDIKDSRDWAYFRKVFRALIECIY